MTGYDSKRQMTANKLWDRPSVAFDEWWNGDNDESTNPFRLKSGAYWAWAGWKAALAQPADNPYEYDWSMLEAAQESLREHMARIKELEAQLAQPAQEPTGMLHIERLDKWLDASFKERKQREWVGLTDDDIEDCMEMSIQKTCRAIEAKLKEKNGD